MICLVKINNCCYLLSLSLLSFRVKVDKSIIHSLESAVIEWGHQIHRVLEKDSSEAVGSRKATPQTELDFWNHRSDRDSVLTAGKNSSNNSCDIGIKVQDTRESYHLIFYC